MEIRIDSVKDQAEIERLKLFEDLVEQAEVKLPIAVEDNVEDTSKKSVVSRLDDFINMNCPEELIEDDVRSFLECNNLNFKTRLKNGKYYSVKVRDVIAITVILKAIRDRDNKMIENILDRVGGVSVGKSPVFVVPSFNFNFTKPENNAAKEVKVEEVKVEEVKVKEEVEVESKLEKQIGLYRTILDSEEFTLNGHYILIRDEIIRFFGHSLANIKVSFIKDIVNFIFADRNLMSLFWGITGIEFDESKDESEELETLISQFYLEPAEKTKKFIEYIYHTKQMKVDLMLQYYTGVIDEAKVDRYLKWFHVYTTVGSRNRNASLRQWNRMLRLGKEAVNMEEICL